MRAGRRRAGCRSQQLRRESGVLGVPKRRALQGVEVTERLDGGQRGGEEAAAAPAHRHGDLQPRRELPTVLHDRGVPLCRCGFLELLERGERCSGDALADPLSEEWEDSGESEREPRQRRAGA